ncbi:hypothetical protein PM082_006796 [Marasmius tenuissimus]|nr:hypothetical protein PM082_006796 [Marasmius tenuissimus]
MELEQVTNHWTWIIGLGAGLFITYTYLRKLFYPCLTLSELENALKALEKMYTKYSNLVSAPIDDEYFE